MTVETSLEAYHAHDTRRRRDAILHALQRRPRTVRELSQDPALPWDEHEVGRRVGDLVTQGYLEKGEKRVNPGTGRRAFTLCLSSEGRHYLRTGDEPRPVVQRGDLVNAVIQAARHSLTTDRDVVDALGVLDAHDAGRAQHRCPAPYGAPQRSSLARQGVWLRRDGSYCRMEAMHDHHLDAAIRWLRRHGARDDHPALAALLGEGIRRQHMTIEVVA